MSPTPLSGRIAAKEGTRRNVAACMYSLAANAKGCAELIAAGACGVLVQALDRSDVFVTKSAVD